MPVNFAYHLAHSIKDTLEKIWFKKSTVHRQRPNVQVIVLDLGESNINKVDALFDQKS